nr:LIM domain-containing protein [Ipomoea batatas]
MSKLSFFDEDRPLSAHKWDRGIRWIARKRHRCGPRSVSGRSSDRSGTRRLRCCSVGASATCWTCSVVSEAARNLSWERDGGSPERESSIATSHMAMSPMKKKKINGC